MTSDRGKPGRGPSHDAAPAGGWIPCCICTDLIGLDEHHQACCWTDPTGVTVAAHRACLVRVGEHELDLPPPPRTPNQKRGGFRS